MEELEQIGRRFDVPQMANMLEGGRTPILRPREAFDLGFAMPVYGISLLMHSVDFVGKGVGFEEYKSIVGFEGWAAIEEKYR